MQGKEKVHEVQLSRVQSKRKAHRLCACLAFADDMPLFSEFDLWSYHSVAYANEIICQLLDRAGGVAGYDAIGVVAYEDGLDSFDD